MYIFTKLFNEHPNSTLNKLTYFQHARFSIYNSFILIISGIIGVIHGVFPFLFPFYTSTTVINSFINIVKSRRHNNEILYNFNKYLNNNNNNKVTYEILFDDNADFINHDNNNVIIVLTKGSAPEHGAHISWQN